MTAVAEVERRLTRLLAAWAALSITVGAVGTMTGRRLGDEALRHFGQQTAVWGLIDGAIAAGGARRNARRDPAEQTRRLRILLWVNAGLDIGYVTGGLRWRCRSTPTAHGNGNAVIVQGLFLLVLDVVHAVQLTGTLSAPTGVSDS